MKSFTRFTFLLSLLGLAWSLSGFSTATAIPFNTNIDFTGFTGTGFTSSPAAGQLDSDSWAITGMSDGSLAFSGTAAAGDFARGASTGGVASGGIYAFDTGAGNIALGIQPVAADFTPGTLTLRLRNDSGGDVVDPNVSYLIWVLNNEARSNSFNFSYSTDNAAYTVVPALNYTSIAAADALGWVNITRATSLTGVTISNGGFLYLRWTGDDAGGANNRDEFGLDDIVVASLTPTAVTLSQTGAQTAALPTLPFAFAFLMLAVASLAIGRRQQA